MRDLRRQLDERISPAPSAPKRRAAFTLIELLVVIAIISLLTSILLPSLSAAKEQARSSRCLSNLHNLGVTMGMYHAANDGSFWRCTEIDRPEPGVTTYFWGTNTDPVDPRASALLAYCDYNLAQLQCPSMPWGSYIPQGHAAEPTTTYGYNAWCLDRGSYLWDFELRPKQVSELKKPSELFVFNDAATVDTWGGGGAFKNSTHLEPPTGTFVQTPTTHFRHLGRTNALCADAHAASFDLEGAELVEPRYDLGFVGERNDPHYDQD
jgi:prepilin-type N-terminal cleavage/methylation domain-containing protein